MLVGRKFTNAKSNIVYDIKKNWCRKLWNSVWSGRFKQQEIMRYKNDDYRYFAIFNREYCSWTQCSGTRIFGFLLYHYIYLIPLQLPYTTTFLTLYHYILKKLNIMCNSSLFHYAAPFSFFILFYFTYMVYYILIHFNLIHFNLIFIIQLKYISF